MKMTKQEFKTLLKECLKELINEGAFANMLAESAKSAQPTGHSSGLIIAQPPSTSALPTQQLNPNLLRTVQAAANILTKNDPGQSKLMESILMDTAMTTLQKQLAGDGVQVGSEACATPEEKAVDNAQLSMLGASRWAQLAFGTPTQSDAKK